MFSFNIMIMIIINFLYIYILNRIYFGESSDFKDDDNTVLKSCNPKLLEYEKSKQRMIIFICDVFLDDPKVSTICTILNKILLHARLTLIHYY